MNSDFVDRRPSTKQLRLRIRSRRSILRSLNWRERWMLSVQAIWAAISALTVIL